MIKFKMPNETEFKHLSAPDLNSAKELINKYINITGSKFSIDDAIIENDVSFDNFPKALVAILEFLDISPMDICDFSEEYILEYFGFNIEFDSDFFKTPKLYDITDFSMDFYIDEPCMFLEKNEILQYIQETEVDMVLLEISEKDGEFCISKNKAYLKHTKPKLILKKF